MKKKKNRGLVALLACAAVLAAAAAVYCIYAAAEYGGKFIEGTEINGLNAGGMTAEEVETEIRDRVEDYTLTVVFRGGIEETITGKEIGLTYTPDNGVETLIENQNVYEWGLGKLGQTMSFTVGEAYTYDEAMLEAAMKALPEFSAENCVEPEDAHLAIGSDHRLKIVEEIDGNSLRESVVLSALKDAVESGQERLDLTTMSNAYRTAEVRSDDADLINQMNDLNTYLDVVVTYEMYDGTVVTLDNTETSGWLSVKDENSGYYYLNTDVLMDHCTEYVRKLAEQYDSLSDSVTFSSTNRGEILIPTAQYGYEIDQADEAAELYNIILSRTSAEREPLYLVCSPGLSTAEGTYIEIDITYQHVYYYINGSVYFDTPCVTGLSTDPDRETPTGIYSIYEKDTNKTLRGDYDESTGTYSYESFVNYWMRFNEGVGLHDASWRSEFGGDIYTYSGSHGCVNLPYSAAQEIYGLCDLGTVVVVI